MLKVVDDVVLAIDFGAIEHDAEASEVEGEDAVRRLLELLPEGAGCGVAMDAAEDDGAARMCVFLQSLHVEGGAGGGQIAIDEFGLRRVGHDGGGAACGGDVGGHGGRSAEEGDGGGRLIVGEAEEEAEVFGGESALGVVLVGA